MDAEDLTQGFFEYFIERNRLDSADENRGRFRTFLLACVKNYCHNVRARMQAVKRGGRTKIVSIDAMAAEARYLSEPADTLTPDQVLQRSYALDLLRRAEHRLIERKADDGMGAALLAAVSDYLFGRGDCEPYADIAVRLNLTEAAVKARVNRLRRELRDTIRDLVGDTVARERDIDHELVQLQQSI